MLPGQTFITASDYAVMAAKQGVLLPPDRHAELAPRLFWSRTDVPQFLPTQTGDVEIAVRCEQGRWLAQCPWCSSAQWASRTDPRYFCSTCLNERDGARWAAVRWPDDTPAIEEALAMRFTEFATWEPGETVADLLEQNAAHPEIVSA